MHTDLTYRIGSIVQNTKFGKAELVEWGRIGLDCLASCWPWGACLSTTCRSRGDVSDTVRLLLIRVAQEGPAIRSADSKRRHHQGDEGSPQGRSPPVRQRAGLPVRPLRHRLPHRHHDHALSENWNDHRDCHVKPDLLLIYQKHDAVTLRLVRLGSFGARLLTLSGANAGAAKTSNTTATAADASLLPLPNVTICTTPTRTPGCRRSWRSPLQTPSKRVRFRCWSRSAGSSSPPAACRPPGWRAR